MIVIEKGATNSVIFTLTEKSQLPAPYYLFDFINDSDAEQKLFNMTDLSGYPRRYNKFNLIESSSQDLPNGKVELDYGWGTYRVYESATQSLVIANTTGRILEEGKYFVKGYPAEFNNNDINNIYF